MEQEQAFLAALQSATRVRIEGDRLELRTADDRLAIIATRSAQVAERKPRTFAADLTYVADAARVTLCREGLSLPLAMEADAASMERAYRASVRSPAAPLHVTFEGAILERPANAGAGAVPTMRVTRLIHAWPGETCERARADASLANTYWRIARFDALDLQAVEGRREPHLLLHSPAQDGLAGDYAASVGCSPLGGSYRVAGQSIAFAAPAAPREACPPPLDAPERQLDAMLARSARWQVTGNTLELLDRDGASLAALQAIYF